MLFAEIFVVENKQCDWRPVPVASPSGCNITLSPEIKASFGVASVCAGLQKITVDEISNVTGGLRLLQALAEAETQAESTHGPPAKVDLDVLWIFVGKVRAHYRTVPYHNFFHVVDVTHATFRFIRLAGPRAKMTASEKLALMVAALCHDMDHPGLNNAFLINTRHEFARVYNDNSVLENRHVSLLYTLLANEPHADIFTDLEDQKWKDMRKLIINCIVHTDMVHHFPMVSKLEVFYELNSATINASIKADTTLSPRMTAIGASFNAHNAGAAQPVADVWKTPEDRQFFMALMLHCADISNAVKPFSIAEKWSKRVLDEFFQQGDMERAQGLPVSPLMDRTTTFLAPSQINFIEFVVAPLFLQVGKVFPELRATVQFLAENRRLWNDMLIADIEADTFKTPVEKATEKEKAMTRLAAFDKKYAIFNSGSSNLIGSSSPSMSPATVNRSAISAYFRREQGSDSRLRSGSSHLDPTPKMRQSSVDSQGEKRSIFQRLGRRQTGEDDGMGEPLSAAEVGRSGRLSGLPTSGTREMRKSKSMAIN